MRSRKHVYRERVLDILENSQIPLSIESIRNKAGIKSWVTAKAILLELVIQGKIAGIKTDKSWAFGEPKSIHAVRGGQLE